MVPRKVGEELRRRRLQLKLLQSDVAKAIGVSRAYVSAIENGTEWDPDAEKLVVWAEVLRWEPDHILRRLGRVASLTEEGMVPTTQQSLSPEMFDAIRQIVREEVRRGIAEARSDEDGPRPRPAPRPASPA